MARDQLRAVEIIAHRGASFDAPENTLAAVRLAWEQHADAVEVDVQLTRDGRLAVIHDSDTRRTTGVGAVVGNSDLARLQQLDAGTWKGPRFAAERIPPLDDVLALMPPGKRIFIELKNGPESVGELGRCLARGHIPVTQIVIISFQLAAVCEAKRRLPGCEAGWIIERDSTDGRRPREEIMSLSHEAGLDGLDLEGAWVDEGWVKQTRADGFKLYTWTIDDAALARHLATVGVSGITTNRPGWMREQLRS